MNSSQSINLILFWDEAFGETMTLFREEVVDFTHPFLYIGLGVIGYRGSAPRSLQQLADDHSVKVMRPFMKKKLKSPWNLSFEII